MYGLPSQTNIIWKWINWHVQRHIFLKENGYVYHENGEMKFSKITRLKPNING